MFRETRSLCMKSKSSNEGIAMESEPSHRGIVMLISPKLYVWRNNLAHFISSKIDSLELVPCVSKSKSESEESRAQSADMVQHRKNLFNDTRPSSTAENTESRMLHRPFGCCI